MRVFYRGFNLYGQFPHSKFVLEDFIDQVYQEFVSFDFSHSFSVLRIGSGDSVSYFGGNSDGYNHFQELKINNSGSEIKEVHCADDKILLLCDNGDLFKVNISDLNIVNEVVKFYETGEKLIKLSVGSKINVAYTDNGTVYNIPEKLKFQNQGIVDIKTGREHCLLLDKDGNIYSFGRGSRGQLGHGCLDDEEEPKLVEALAGLKIVSIACGGWHSCAISYAGDLYVWGWNGNGQLGLDSDQSNEVSVAVMATPKLVDVESPEENVCKVSCGNRHTVILLENKKLYGCGWNKYKQLINNDKENIISIIYLHDFSNRDVVDLKCGPWSTSVFCKE